MKTFLKFMLGNIVLSAFLLGNMAKSCPAYPFPFKYKQPDGTEITIRLHGDERLNWAETTDNYSLLRNANNGWEYAILDHKGDMMPSGILAADPEKRTREAVLNLNAIPKSLRFSKEQVNLANSIYSQRSSAQRVFTPTGNKRLVMILVSFTDRAFTRTRQEFDNLMNQAGFNLNGAVGSVRDYFLENSYNQFDITTTVVGPYTLSQNMTYYGGNDAAGNDMRPREMVTEAVNLANPDVNYADFDNDNDGTVDGVYVVYAGYGEASSAPANTIWPHAWNIVPVTKDGKSISKYSCSSELSGTAGTNISTIGVICHEFGHVCGAPDYYDTDYATNGQYDGTGMWDLMAAGSWNRVNQPGDCPPHVNGYQKRLYGWTNPRLLNTAQNVTLLNSAQNNDFCFYNTTTANEIYFCENRQRVGFDRGIPGHGLIVYHVDGAYVTAHKNANNINTTSHQGLYPVCANAAGNPPTYGTINGAGCPFPGTGNKTIFTDATTPNAKSWAGANTNAPLTNIAEAAGVITFCYISCAPGAPIDLTATGVSSSQIDLTWQLNSASNPILLVYTTDSVFGTPINGTNYVAGNTITGGGTVIYAGTNTSFNHTGLSASTKYYYRAWSKLVGTTYSTAANASAKTLCGSITNFPHFEGFENGGNIPQCWTQENVVGTLNWRFRAGSNSNPSTAFDGSYNANFYEGAYNTQNISKLISPPLAMSSLNNPTLSFALFNQLWTNDQDVLKIYYRTSVSGTWTLLQTYDADIAAWTEMTLSLPNKSNQYFIAFEATDKYGHGVCIDNVRIYDNAALPIALISFSGKCSKSGNLLSWQTASETNSKEFIISKSYNGTDFFSIAVLEAAGNSNVLKEYNFTDQGESLSAYYKLVEKDVDGSEPINKVIYVTCSPEDLVLIYPNPAENELFIKGGKENVLCSIQDLTGRILISAFLIENRIDISGLKPGMYILTYNGQRLQFIKD